MRNEKGRRIVQVGNMLFLQCRCDVSSVFKQFALIDPKGTKRTIWAGNYCHLCGIRKP